MMNATDQQALTECHAALGRIQRQIAALIAAHEAERKHVDGYKRAILQRPVAPSQLNPS